MSLLKQTTRAPLGKEVVGDGICRPWAINVSIVVAHFKTLISCGLVLADDDDDEAAKSLSIPTTLMDEYFLHTHRHWV